MRCPKAGRRFPDELRGFALSPLNPKMFLLCSQYATARHRGQSRGPGVLTCPDVSARTHLDGRPRGRGDRKRLNFIPDACKIPLRHLPPHSKLDAQQPVARADKTIGLTSKTFRRYAHLGCWRLDSLQCFNGCVQLETRRKIANVDYDLQNSKQISTVTHPASRSLAKLQFKQSAAVGWRRQTGAGSNFLSDPRHVAR